MFLNLGSVETATLSFEVRVISLSSVQRTMPLGRGKPEATPSLKAPFLAIGTRRFFAMAA